MALFETTASAPDLAHASFVYTLRAPGEKTNLKPNPKPKPWFRKGSMCVEYWTVIKMAVWLRLLLRMVPWFHVFQRLFMGRASHSRSSLVGHGFGFEWHQYNLELLIHNIPFQIIFGYGNIIHSFNEEHWSGYPVTNYPNYTHQTDLKSTSLFDLDTHFGVKKTKWLPGYW